MDRPLRIEYAGAEIFARCTYPLNYNILDKNLKSGPKQNYYNSNQTLVNRYLADYQPDFVSI